jgi:hypothetical protein
MKFSDNVYFTVDTIDNNFNLSEYFSRLFEQFFSTFHAFTVREDDKFIRYKVNATIERDYCLNKYEFYLVYNKKDDYYVLLNREKCTVLDIHDNDFNYSVIEPELINILLIQIFGYIPRFFFDEDGNRVYSKIVKYLNNRIQRYMNKYRNPITEYIGTDECGDQYQMLYQGTMIPEYIFENIINHNLIEYINRISSKGFLFEGKIYKYESPIKHINFYNAFCKRNIPKTAIKIQNIKYLNY